MPFDTSTQRLLAYYTNYSPRTEDAWYGPWINILTALFPSSHGYIVTPRRLTSEHDETYGNIADLALEVVKLRLSTTQSIPHSTISLRTVLIVKIRNTQHWGNGNENGIGIRRLAQQIAMQTEAAFAGTAYAKVYWIGVIGPRWTYGVKEVDREQDALIPWHEVTHDTDSFADMAKLTKLVEEM